MPKTNNSGEPIHSELPSTLAKSEKKAQRTFAETYDSAMDEYDDEERAHKVAYAALKHSYEKIGDHWEAKAQKGPSDERAESGGPNASGKTAGGIDANANKEHLLSVARRLDISGRSKMTKAELVEAIDEANERASAASRRAPSN